MTCDPDRLAIGAKSREWLARVGITTRSQLLDVGAYAAYRRVVEAGHPENRNLYYGLAAIVLGVHWQEARHILAADPDALTTAAPQPAPARRPVREAP